MSLNGLEELAVIVAYHSALVETGGWFLLKYINRDTVDVLDQGIGGVSEARIAVEHYPEKSPLYGFLQHRRRKIILKYVPEGTSRLLQVRLSVQFQSVLEKFSPHETVFTFAAAKELTESALTSACVLHTSSIASLASSASSARHQRLDEITEDAEQSGTSGKTPGADATLKDSQNTRHGRSQLTAEALQMAAAQKRMASRNLQIEPPPRTSSLRPLHTPRLFNGLAQNPPTVGAPSEAAPAVSPPREDITQSGASRPANSSLDDPWRSGAHLRRQSIEPRHSSLSSRLSTLPFEPDRTIHDNEPNSKVSRALRPATLVQYKRPKIAQSTESGSEKRPIANLPTTVRVSNRFSSVNSHRQSSKQPVLSLTSNTVPHCETSPSPAPLIRPSPAQIPTVFAPSQTDFFAAKVISSTKSQGPALEKQRLMKALQLRKRQIAQSSRAAMNTNSISDEIARRMAELNEVQTAERLQSFAITPPDESQPDLVHMGYDEEQKQAGSGQIISSIPLPEVFEGLSTQDSSFTDEDDHATCERMTEMKELDLSSPDDDDVNSMTGTQVTETEARQSDAATAVVYTDENNSLLTQPLAREQLDSNTPDIGAAVTDYQTETSPRPVAEVGSFTREKIDEHRSTPPPTIFLPQNPIQHASPSKRSKRSISRKRHQLRLTTVDFAGSERYQKGISGSAPIKVLSSPESDVSDDDSFMEEIQSAVVEEAKPISVARSSFTPIYSMRSSDRLRSMGSRIFSSSEKSSASYQHTPQKDTQTVARKTLESFTQWTPSPSVSPPPSAKKGKLSSGISKRIKALEMFSARESCPTVPTSSPTSQAALNPLPVFMKGGSFAPLKHTGTPSPRQLPSPSPTPSVEKPPPIPQQPWVMRDLSTMQESVTKCSGDTISVTARIIRTPEPSDIAVPVDPSELIRTHLYQSPLTVQREVPESLDRPATPKATSTNRLDSPGKLELTRDSISSNYSSPTRSPPFPSSRSSPSRRRASSWSLSSPTRLRSSESAVGCLSQGNKHFKAETCASSPTARDNLSVVDEKKTDSRKHRLVKRMSMITAGSRPNFLAAVTTPVKVEKPASYFPPSAPSTSQPSPGQPAARDAVVGSYRHVVDIGDVNVQFPDTLLWKRRFVRIDDQGFLILTPPTIESNLRGVSRKFHLSEIKKPTLPDAEREELPFSLLLDLEDGSCLQCACESRYAQGQVLRTLVDAHSAYHQLHPK